MSHHFDTAAAQQDGRLDLCDLYLFAGEAEHTTALILTVNPFAGEESPTTFHPQGIYEFKIDTSGDYVEEISYRVTFGVADVDGRQIFELHRAEGPEAQRGRTGRYLASGRTGATLPTAGGGRIWAGVAADPFFGNGAGLDRFNHALLVEQRFDPHAFDNAENSFAGRKVTAIVLEVPTAALGAPTLRVWATTSLWHPEEQVQINRAATPLMLHLFHEDELPKMAYDRGRPADDRSRSGAEVAGRVASVTGLAGTVADPRAYGESVAQMLLPDVLTYRSAAPAQYTAAARNGRPLADDGMDAVLSLLTCTPFSDQVHSPGCYQSMFPYLLPRAGA